jgi:ABC-type amino acid transport substrate-binding protein
LRGFGDARQTRQTLCSCCAGNNPKLYFRLADLRRLKVCVLRGFPLEEDMVDARQVDDQSTSLEQLFSKVQQGRCDAALEREDVVDHLAQGQASLARWVRQMRLKAEKVPQDSAVRYHVVVSRQMPGSERLQGMLDARLRRLHQQGLLPLKPGTPVQEMP